MARVAEEVGFDSIWVGDHLLYRGDGRPERGPWEAWSLLAGLAAVTSRVRLGPLVACTAFSPPAVLAKRAAAVQEISGGRLVLGLGAGWNEPDFRAFGVPFDQRVSRFEESFEVIRRLVAGERVTFHGRFVDVEDSVLLPAVPPPELMIGSNAPRMLSIALPHVGWWNTWFSGYGNTPEGFASLSATIDQACLASGREPGEVRRSACVLVALDAEGRERHREGVSPIAAGDVAAAIDELAGAGADEVILVVEPITEASIRELGEALT
jgi:alkanesulfonate monooxygenase SsuD/methylene tetrahydromethanopterin reductase-like flavin-dependent oxidoreductase (luciferase family)